MSLPSSHLSYLSRLNCEGPAAGFIEGFEHHGTSLDSEIPVSLQSTQKYVLEDGPSVWE